MIAHDPNIPYHCSELKSVNVTMHRNLVDVFNSNISPQSRIRVGKFDDVINFKIFTQQAISCEFIDSFFQKLCCRSALRYENEASLKIISGRRVFVDLFFCIVVRKQENQSKKWAAFC
jgi:hypothetical protein